MSTDELVKSYLAQGYTSTQAERLAKLTADEPELAPAASTPEEGTTPPTTTPRHARARSGSRRGKGADSSTPKVADTRTSSEAAGRQGEMRAWAKAKGIDVPARGTVPRLVREMWEQENHVNA